MRRDRSSRWSRRDFLGAAACTGTGALLGLRSGPVTAEPPPETNRVRMVDITGICSAPQHVARELLQAEGFTEVQYVKAPPGMGTARAIGAGDVDVSINFAGPLVIRLDLADPIVLLGGIHAGCFVLFGSERVRSVRDLKGRSVGVQAIGSSQHVFLASMMAHVGLDAQKDVNWVTRSPQESMRLLAEGGIDAFLGFPPEPQELRARKVGRVIVDSGKDRPWSQYFCCMVAGNRTFVRKHPVATKRALRALLKAANFCAVEPQRAARLIADRGYNYEYALETLKDIPYDKWREYDPEDTVRFYALRLREAGMIKSTPSKILAQGTDWRFLKELTRELKA